MSLSLKLRARPVNAGANMALSSVASAYQFWWSHHSAKHIRRGGGAASELKSDVFSGATDVLSFLETTRTTVIPVLTGFNQQAQISSAPPSPIGTAPIL